MKKEIKRAIATGLAALVCASAAYSAEGEKTATPQQQRMSDCNKTAGEKALKGDERKQFMSSCLSGKDAAAPAASSSQQDKMKNCNAEAGKQNLKGDDRKKFMSSCLSG